MNTGLPAGYKPCHVAKDSPEHTPTDLSLRKRGGRGRAMYARTFSPKPTNLVSASPPPPPPVSEGLEQGLSVPFSNVPWSGLHMRVGWKCLLPHDIPERLRFLTHWASLLTWGWALPGRKKCTVRTCCPCKYKGPFILNTYCFFADTPGATDPRKFQIGQSHIHHLNPHLRCPRFWCGSLPHLLPVFMQMSLIKDAFPDHPIENWKLSPTSVSPSSFPASFFSKVLIPTWHVPLQL